MPTNRRRRSVIILGSMLAASLAMGSLAAPVGAVPDAEEAEQRAEQRADREAARAERKAERQEARWERQAERVAERAERKADRQAMRADRRAERDARQAERVALREARKAVLEARKDEAKALREEARAAIAFLREGIPEMTVEERQETLDQIREIRAGYVDAFLLLMADWRDERDELLPNTLDDAAEPAEEGELQGEPEGVLEED